MPHDNLLLAQLSEPALRHIRSRCEHVALRKRDVLLSPGEPVRYAYFPTAGLLSLDVADTNGRVLELAAMGREGMAGLPVVFRSETDGFRVSVRSAGEGLRIRAADLASTAAEVPEVHRILLEYVHHLLADVAQTGFCLSAHNTLQRLCRWLVHATDITGTATIDVTHEDLTQIVGVARSAISQAMAELQDADAIWFHRGRILIRSRARLSASMCDCHRLSMDGARVCNSLTS